jgi:hypothetical protein
MYLRKSLSKSLSSVFVRTRKRKQVVVMSDEMRRFPGYGQSEATTHRVNDLGKISKSFDRICDGLDRNRRMMGRLIQAGSGRHDIPAAQAGSKEC